MNEPRISLVVDRPSPSGQSLLILPFAASESEGALGRQIGVVLQRRLQFLPDLMTGHGLLIAVSARARSYQSLPRPLSAERALACATSWGATLVLSGAITLLPSLRWNLRLQDVATGEVLFEDALVGEPEDLPYAPSDVARVVAEALGLEIVPSQHELLETVETLSLPALLAYVHGLDLRPQHGLTEISWETMCLHLLRALFLDPAFEAPCELLLGDLLAAQEGADTWASLLEVIDNLGREGLAGAIVLAQALEDRGHAQQAVALATAVLERDPAQPQALNLLAHHAYRAGQFARARTLTQALLDLQPEHAGAQELLGNLLSAAGRYPGAAQHWEIAIALEPRRAKALLRLGSYLAVAGEYSRAYEALSQATSLGSATPESLYQLGKVAYRLGMFEEGIAALQRALLLDPERAKTHTLLARSYLRAGRSDLALVHDGRVRELLPGFWPAALGLGHAALRQGRIAEALEAFTQAARTRPDLADALQGLGRALVAGNMLEAGIEVLTRAHELRPDDISISYALIGAYLQAGWLEPAERIAADAAFRAPDRVMTAKCLSAVQRYRHSQYTSC